MLVEDVRTFAGMASKSKSGFGDGVNDFRDLTSDVNSACILKSQTRKKKERRSALFSIQQL
jgi:hypothetical protein